MMLCWTDAGVMAMFLERVWHTLTPFPLARSTPRRLTSATLTSFDVVSFGFFSNTATFLHWQIVVSSTYCWSVIWYAMLLHIVPQAVSGLQHFVYLTANASGSCSLGEAVGVLSLK